MHVLYTTTPAVAHTVRCGGGACAHVKLHRPKLAVTVRALHRVRVHTALTDHQHGLTSNGMADTGGWKLADACGVTSAALAHSLSCGGQACAQVKLHRPKSSLSPRALFVVCKCTAVKDHEHGPMNNAVADTGR